MEKVLDPLKTCPQIRCEDCGICSDQSRKKAASLDKRNQVVDIALKMNIFTLPHLSDLRLNQIKEWENQGRFNHFLYEKIRVHHQKNQNFPNLQTGVFFTHSTDKKTLQAHRLHQQ